MYDVIIIGAGPAGISASLYTVRSNLKTLIIYKGDASIKKATKIDNYYGFENGVSGEELYKIGIKQAENVGADIINEEVTNIQVDFVDGEQIFKIQTPLVEYISKTVILATGNKKHKPNIENIDNYEGRGVSYCAICDGFFYRGKDVAVVGNGEYAMSEVEHLKNIANSVTVLTNGLQAPNFDSDNISTVETEIKAVSGDGRVEEIEFKDNSTIKITGLFIAQGVAGSTDFAKKLGAEIENNIIKVNENMETSIKGLYACGDAVGGLYQVSKAVYEGTKAGLQVIKYLK